MREDRVVTVANIWRIVQCAALAVVIAAAGHGHDLVLAPNVIIRDPCGVCNGWTCWLIGCWGW